MDGGNSSQNNGKVDISQFGAHSVAYGLRVCIVLDFPRGESARGVVGTAGLSGKDANRGSALLVPTGDGKAGSGQKSATAHGHAHPVQLDAAGSAVLQKFPSGRPLAQDYGCLVGGVDFDGPRASDYAVHSLDAGREIGLAFNDKAPGLAHGILFKLRSVAGHHHGA